MENLKPNKQPELLLPPPSPKKTYILVGIIAALVFIIGGTGLWFLSTQKQTPSQVPVVTNPDIIPQDEALATNDWIVIRNRDFHFEFKIPPNWVNATPWLEIPADPRNFYSVYANGKKSTEDLVFFISGVSDNNGVFKELTNLEVGTVQEISGKSLRKLENLKLDNLPAVKYTYSNKPERPGTKAFGVPEDMVLIRIGMYVINFSLSALSDNAIQNNSYIFDQILSTFRFIDSCEISVDLEDKGVICGPNLSYKNEDIEIETNYHLGAKQDLISARVLPNGDILIKDGPFESSSATPWKGYCGACPRAEMQMYYVDIQESEIIRSFDYFELIGDELELVDIFISDDWSEIKIYELPLSFEAEERVVMITTFCFESDKHNYAQCSEETSDSLPSPRNMEFYNARGDLIE